MNFCTLEFKFQMSNFEKKFLGYKCPTLFCFWSENRFDILNVGWGCGRLHFTSPKSEYDRFNILASTNSTHRHYLSTRIEIQGLQKNYSKNP